ncbi:MAG: hypothetical protein WAV47_18630, partial [Blastocatellia bacterium]
VWEGSEGGKETPPFFEPAAETQPLQSTVDPIRVARVSERTHRGPFDPPTIERIVHREPYETPRIEPLTPRDQAAASRELSLPSKPGVGPASREGARDAGTMMFGTALPPEPDRRETRQLAAESFTAQPKDIPEPAIASTHLSGRTARAGSILGLPAEASHRPLILGDPVRSAREAGIGSLTNYGKDLEQKGGRGGTIALLAVALLLTGAVLFYLLVPSVHSRVGEFVSRVRGTDAQSRARGSDEVRAQVIPSYRPEVNKNMVTARGAIDNISNEPLENLTIEVSLLRGGDAPPDVRVVSVTPNPLPPGTRGAFEFEYDGKRDTGFTGYKITRLLSNGIEVRFRAPGQK